MGVGSNSSFHTAKTFHITRTERTLESKRGQSKNLPDRLKSDAEESRRSNVLEDTHAHGRLFAAPHWPLVSDASP